MNFTVKKKISKKKSSTDFTTKKTACYAAYQMK